MKIEGESVHLKARTYLYRMDKLPFSGGNKWPRLYEFFRNYPDIDTLVVMSDAGAHTFKGVMDFFEKQGTPGLEKLRIERMIFLENQMPSDPYREKIRSRYLNHPKITVHAGPTWKMFVTYWILKLKPGLRHLGIGGHVKVRESYFQDIFRHSIAGLEDGRVLHILPVSSGDMLKEFLQASDRNHLFVGIMTGHALTRKILRLRFGRERRLRLIEPEILSDEKNLRIRQAFKEQRGITLDPVHSIQAILAMNRLGKRYSGRIVVWMTQPDVDEGGEDG